MGKNKLFILLLIICIQLTAAEVIGIPGLGKPDSLSLFNDRLYITDQDHIAIFSLKDCKLIKTFGRQGEGPGEFKISPIDKIGLRITVRAENILINCWGKISLFTLDGNFIEEKKIIVNSATQLFKPFGPKYIGFLREIRDNTDYYLVNFYDPMTLQKEKEICCMKAFLTNNSIDVMRLALVLKNDNRRGPIYQVCDDKLFIEGEDCQIFVYDQQGKKINSLRLHDYEKLEIPGTFKNEIMTYLEKRLPTTFVNVKQNGKFPLYFPLQSFQTSDGKLYVQTFKQNKDESEFYIFYPDGKLLGKTMVPFHESELLRAYPFTIANGKLYQLIENEKTGEWELHIYEIGCK
jgi:hypothetical protein